MEAQIPAWAKLEVVNMYLEAMIMFIEATAFSGDNCLKVIKELNLYPDLIDKVPLAELISQMKENYHQKALYTTVPGKSGGKPEEVITGFEFSFDYNDPQKAFQVANMLATNFIEYYKKFREGFASSTSTFFGDERERLKDEISQIDQKIADFKEKNVNELPELFVANYSQSWVINQKMFNYDQQVQLLNSQKRNLESTLATLNPLIAMQGVSGERIVTPEEKITVLKADLALMSTKYSEKHPDIIRTRKEIGKIEKLLSEKNERGSAVQGGATADFSGAYNPAYVNILTQLDQINLELEKLRNEKTQNEQDLAKYNDRVAKTPLVEKEYRVLNRDLDSAQKRYNDLVNQVLTLESSAAMEKREMGGKLTVGMPPTFPLKPTSPNRPLIIAASFMTGLALGILLLLGWDFLTQTVRTPQDLLNICIDTPVLSVLPVLTSQPSRLISLRKLTGPICLGVIIIIIFLIDAFYINIDILTIKILSAIKIKLILLGF
ncbi:MAG: hypothetical protein WCQ99_02600 [Pseudomonadota bacterium]